LAHGLLEGVVIPLLPGSVILFPAGAASASSTLATNAAYSFEGRGWRLGLVLIWQRLGW
jgi:membrane protein DedA with SNARE-associated domain